MYDLKHLSNRNRRTCQRHEPLPPPFPVRRGGGLGPPPALEAKFAAFAGDEAAAADAGLGFPEFLMLTNALIRPSTETLGTTPEPRESGEMAGSGFVFPTGFFFDFNLVGI